MKLFQEMQEQGPPPNFITYNAIIPAMAQTAGVRKTLDVLKQIHNEQQLSFNIYSLNSLISACKPTNDAKLVS